LDLRGISWNLGSLHIENLGRIYSDGTQILFLGLIEVHGTHALN